MSTSSEVSLVVLTYNRGDVVKQAMEHNIRHAGDKIDEIIWVDNGSTDNVRDVMKEFNPDVSVLNKVNLGVAKGYNRGMALSTKPLIAITGCDRLMPDNWLVRMKQCLENKTCEKEIAVASCYSKQIQEVPERLYMHVGVALNSKYITCLPMEARLMKRMLLKEAGYMREDFGLYGWEDVEFAHRLMRIIKVYGLESVTLNGFVARHLGHEGNSGGYRANKADSHEYWEFKRRESEDPSKLELLKKCESEGFNFYSPF